MINYKKMIRLYNECCVKLYKTIEEKPLEYWQKVRDEAFNQKAVRWEAGTYYNPMKPCYIGNFLGYYHPCPVEEILYYSDYVREGYATKPLSADNVDQVNRHDHIVYGFDSEDKLIIAFDSKNCQYSFEYQDNKVLIVKYHIPFKIIEPEEEDLEKAFARMYKEQYPYPEIFQVAECEYDEAGRIIKYILADFRDDKWTPDGNLRKLDYKVYRYNESGLVEEDYFEVFVHLRRKEKVLIPDQYFSSEYDKYSYEQRYKKLLREGFTTWIFNYRFYHDDKGYIYKYQDIRENGKVYSESKVKADRRKRL